MNMLCVTTAHTTGTKPQDLACTAVQWKQWWLPFTCSSGMVEMKVGNGAGGVGGEGSLSIHQVTDWGRLAEASPTFVCTEYTKSTTTHVKDPTSTFPQQGVLLEKFIPHVFPHTPGESYHRWLRLLCSCDVCWELTPSFCYCCLFLCKRPQNQW